MLTGKISTKELFNLTALLHRIISRRKAQPQVTLLQRSGQLTAILKHGTLQVNCAIPSESLNGRAKVNCNIFDAALKAVRSDEVELISTQQKIRILGDYTSVGIFQYPMEQDDFETIVEGEPNLVIPVNDYRLISQHLPRTCDMVHFRKKYITWWDKHNVYIVSHRTPDPFILPRDILLSLTNSEERMHQSRNDDNNIVLRWGNSLVQYRENMSYMDKELDRKLLQLSHTKIGEIELPSLNSFTDLKIDEIKWTPDDISSYRHPEYSISMKFQGEITSSFITSIPKLPPFKKGTVMHIYNVGNLIMFETNNWKLFVNKIVEN